MKLIKFPHVMCVTTFNKFKHPNHHVIPMSSVYYREMNSCYLCKYY